ncbi:MAG: hypothetical protein R2751_01725 [Bacteroidales bacterium]
MARMLAKMGIRITLLILLFHPAALTAQASYLHRPDLQAMADSCLRHTYGFQFDQARWFQEELQKRTPGHPAPSFLHALLVYWENFPLTPGEAEESKFLGLMDESIRLAQDMIPHPETHLEGVFFDLHARAFKAMHHADNGKIGPVVPDLRSMYSFTREGFGLKDEFIEFYFSTGLYNYYIEAYPEAHPAYKPLVSFMQKGDKALGLKQLNRVINEGVFLRTEAILFMSLIQLNYEKDLNTAALYAERLFREFPKNTYYQGHLVTIQLHRHRYERVDQILRTMDGQNDPYSRLVREYARAFLAEGSGNQKVATEGYRRTLFHAEEMGEFANLFQAMACMGLSRIHASQGQDAESRRMARQAGSLTKYSFVLEEKNSVSR